jgi:serine/threonine-protein kinase
MIGPVKICGVCGRTYPDEAGVCPADETPLTEAASTGDLVGHVLDDRYKVEERLGAGGLGEVYRARHLKMGKAFAVKVLHGALSRDPAFVARFDREARALSKLEHPYCVACIDYGTSAAGPYIVMDLVEGTSLSHYTRGRGLPLGEALQIIGEMLAGLHHAHQVGIVHRDLKPDNVMLVKDPLTKGKRHPKILDFGIAKIRADAIGGPATSTLTQLGTVVGTPAYLAPEQAAGSGVDQRTDVYAAGIIAYELCCGRRPFDGPDKLELIRAQLLTPPPPPRDLRKALPEDLVAVVLKALAKRPKDRWQTADEFREALAGIKPLKPALAAERPPPRPGQENAEVTPTTSIDESAATAAAAGAPGVVSAPSAKAVAPPARPPGGTSPPPPPPLPLPRAATAPRAAEDDAAFRRTARGKPVKTPDPTGTATQEDDFRRDTMPEVGGPRAAAPAKGGGVARFLALAVLLAGVGGGAWYLFGGFPTLEPNRDDHEDGPNGRSGNDGVRGNDGARTGAPKKRDDTPAPATAAGRDSAAPESTLAGHTAAPDTAAPENAHTAAPPETAAPHADLRGGLVLSSYVPPDPLRDAVAAFERGAKGPGAKRISEYLYAHKDDAGGRLYAARAYLVAVWYGDGLKLVHQAVEADPDLTLDDDTLVALGLAFNGASLGDARKLMKDHVPDGARRARAMLVAAVIAPYANVRNALLAEAERSGLPPGPTAAAVRALAVAGDCGKRTAVLPAALEPADDPTAALLRRWLRLNKCLSAAAP